METNLSRTVDITKDKARYDASVKEILADKQVLARILKYTMDEFANMEIKDIINCVGEPEIGKVRIEPGLTNSEKVLMTNTEDVVVGEGKIYFDIRFNAYCNNGQIKILVNIEAQKSTSYSELKYQLDNRIIYYLARMISSQKEVEFTKSNYDDIKAVKSIWICMDSDDESDSINRFSFKQESVYGKDMEFHNLHKVQGIIVRIRKNEDSKASKNNLIAMLEELLKKEDAEIKKKNLENYYELQMDKETERRINSMCNLSDVVEENAMKKGIEKGIEQGIEKGMKEGAQEAKEVLSKLFLELEKLGRIADYSKAMQDEEYLEKLKEEFNLNK